MNIERYELADQPWVFAIKEAALPLLSVNKDSLYPYSYQLPNDCLRLAMDIEFMIEGDVLATDVFPLRLRYVSGDVNPALYPQYFVNLLESRLALEMCETTREDYERVKARACFLNAKCSPPQIGYTGRTYRF